MSENFNQKENNCTDFDAFRTKFEACPPKFRQAILWLLSNWDLANQITGVSKLSEFEVSTLLHSESADQDAILKILLFYQKFKQEDAAADRPPV